MLRHFAPGITADRASELRGLHHKTTLVLFRLPGARIAELIVADCSFEGQGEIDATASH